MFGNILEKLWKREERPIQERSRFQPRCEQLEDRCVPSTSTLGGLYSITFAAADPTLYQHVLASSIKHGPQKTVTKDPIAGADYELMVNGTPTVVGVKSLPGAEMTFGQIVPFFFVVSMSSSSTPLKSTTVTITADWPTLTSSNGNFGYNPTYGVMAAFVDKGDLATVGTSKASVTYTWSVVNAQIQGVFTVTGITPGSTIVVDVWVVLDTSLNGASGDVTAKLVSATAQDGSSISVGTQTIPLNQVSSIPATSGTPLLSLTSVGSGTAASSSDPVHKNSPSSQFSDLLFSLAGNELGSSL